MIAFHGDPKIKEKYLTRVKKHREADNLIQGIGWENGKGCAIGCTLENYDLNQYEIELGIPIMLAKLEDCIFEGLQKEKAMLWPERFLSAIKVGQDLRLIGSKFLFEIVKRQYEKLNADQLKLVGKEIFQVLYVLDAWCKDGVVKGSDFAREAYSAASDASAAWSARSAASAVANAAASAAWSARSAASAVANAAASAAYCAAYSAAYCAAYSATEYERMSELLISLIKEFQSTPSGRY